MSNPSSVLIVGAGVFGLSTALALSRRESFRDTKLTVLEACPTIPNPHGSSVDTSRIVRADYAIAPYADLAAQAQKIWRETEWGAEGRYTESGLVLVANKDKDAYVKSSLENVTSIAKKSGEEEKIEVLHTRNDIQRVMGEDSGVIGDWGYANWSSGWADAEASVKYAADLIRQTGRVEIRTGQVARLLRERRGKDVHVKGAELADGSTILAETVVLATGAWTPQLVDLRGRAESTGQCLAYVELTDKEQELLGRKPIILNFSTGMFIIPPRNRLLKVARHAFGYRNPRILDNPDGAAEKIEVSVPRTDVPVPLEGEVACRETLRDIVPNLGDRPFVQTRICWYTDTPKGDFLIDYHPDYSGLFLATGGSGHGFKFFPVIGEKIADALERRLEPALKELWAWPTSAVSGFLGTEDGSRSGEQGLILEEELKRQRCSL